MANNNNNNNDQQQPFWDFAQSFNPQHPYGAGTGVDHAGTHGVRPPWAAPFDGSHPIPPWAYAGWGSWGGPFGGPWGHGGPGRRGHHHHHHRGDQDAGNDEEQNDAFDAEKSPETMRQTDDDAAATGGAHPPPPPPPPPPGAPHPPPPPPGAPHHLPPPPFPFGHGPWGGRGRGRGCGRGSGRGRGRWGPGSHHGPPPPPEYTGPFDFRPLMHAFANHPLAETIREYFEQAQAGTSRGQNDSDNESFVPPVDTFNTETAYVLHIALPGCAKEDVGVHWDAEKGVVNVAGVVYRPGDESFNQGLVSSERKVGMFERSIRLPPPGINDKEDIDGFSITAKMENGLLIVTVPKVEKEWTEIRKVDIN